MMTICHRPTGGEPQTLTLPRPAAEAHLRQHPNDTSGICPIIAAAPESAPEEDRPPLPPPPVVPEEVTPAE